MKSTIIATALLASAAIAQPHHGHHRRHQHDKRELVVEWVTELETVTVIIDDATTETVYPTKTAEVAASSSGSPGQFFQSASTSSSTSAAAPSTTLVVQPSTEQAAAVAASPSTISTSTSTTPVAVPTTTTQAPAPVEPTTTEAATTEAATTEAAQTTIYAATPAATTTAASSGSGSSFQDTDMTYYQIGLGSCGYDDAGLDLTKPVVAVDSVLWDSVSSATSYGIDQPAHPFCNQEITITYEGKTTTGVIRDRCGACQPNAIDVSEIVFTDLVGSTTAGRVQVSWDFNSYTV